jgi:hypothetical protein
MLHDQVDSALSSTLDQCELIRVCSKTPSTEYTIHVIIAYRIVFFERCYSLRCSRKLIITIYDKRNMP